ncbi:MAG: metal ABC transporter permease, partial [Firmicutes bacterium]|nr:metal ABC transporter permease [Bacillota bacterium]
YEFVIAAIVGVVIAISMQLVGSLLTSALIIFPALSAMRVAKTYKKVSIFASIIAVGSAIIGYFLALATDWAPGATIILFNLVVFLVMWLVGFVFRKKIKA